MMFCTQCGSSVSNDWNYCGACAARIQTPSSEPTVPSPVVPSDGHSRDRGNQPVVDMDGTRELDSPAPRVDSSAWWATSAALLGLAAVVTFVALFPSYHEGGDSLAEDTGNLWFNLPAIVAWAAAAILMLNPRSRAAGGGLAVGTTFVWMSAYVSDVGVLVTGEKDAGPGAVLGLSGIALALIGALIAARALVLRRERPFVSPSEIWWPLLAATIGVVFAVGTAMSWTQLTIRITERDLTWDSTGTTEISEQCCALSDFQGWDLADNILLMGSAVVVLLLASAWRQRAVSIGALLGAGAAMVAFPLAGIIAASETVTPSDLDYSFHEIREAGLTVDQVALPGLWITAVAAVSVFVLAAIRAIHATNTAS